MMVASGVGALFFLVLGSLTLFSARSFVSMANYVELEDSSRNALDWISREVRQADSLANWSSNLIALNYTNGTQIIYSYNPYARTLKRSLGGEEKTLLKECDNLKFSIYQRNPVNGAYDQYPVATAGTCKLIQVDWKCSRQILKAKINTEVVQSAKIVIRRQ